MSLNLTNGPVMSKEQLSKIVSKMTQLQSSGNSEDIFAIIEAKRRIELSQSRQYSLPKDVYYSHFEGDSFYAAIVRNGKVAHHQIILYLHGGNFVSGSAMISRNHVSRLSEAANMSVLNVDYRLAPEFTFPAALEDALAAYRWLLKSDYSNLDIAFVGGSTGCHLALSTLAYLKRNQEPLPAAVALMSPWLDHKGSKSKSIYQNASKDLLVDVGQTRRLFELYRGETNVDDPLINPHKLDLTGFPPFFIQVGENEVILDDTLWFADQALRDGVPVQLEVWPDMIHGFQTMEELDESFEAVCQVGDWLKSALRG